MFHLCPSVAEKPQLNREYQSGVKRCQMLSLNMPRDCEHMVGSKKKCAHRRYHCCHLCHFDVGRWASCRAEAPSEGRSMSDVFFRVLSVLLRLKKSAKIGDARRTFRLRTKHFDFNNETDTLLVASWDCNRVPADHILSSAVAQGLWRNR